MANESLSGRKRKATTQMPGLDRMTAVTAHNLNGDIPSAQLFETFEEYTIGLRSMSTLMCAGRCDVDGGVDAILFFDTEKHARDAVAKLNGNILQGRVLRLAVAENHPLRATAPPSSNTECSDAKNDATNDAKKMISLSRSSSLWKPSSVALFLLIALISSYLRTSLRSPQTDSSDPTALMASAKVAAEWNRLNVERYRSMEILEFEYESDFDTNGIMHHVGTGGGRFAWENPARSGSVRVRHHPSKWGRNPTLALQRDGKGVSFTGPVQDDGDSDAWYVFDLGETRRVVPTAYTLRSLTEYAASSNAELRHWVFEGSSDGNTWHVLRRHSGRWFGTTWETGDQSLVGSGSSSWSVHVDAHVDISDRLFRYLRIRQIGPNRSDDPLKRKSMYLNGFEVYGVLIQVP